MNTFRVLAALLTYPTERMLAAVPEMKTILREEGVLPEADQEALVPLFTELAGRDRYDLEARYIELFDQSRSMSLHLFEHVHGESRDRGQAMVNLLERYREAGLELSARELPDFLPVWLEYLSQLPLDEARQSLVEPLAVLTTLGRRLAKRESSYAAVLSALEHMAQAQPDEADLQELAQEETEETRQRQDLDTEWEEKPVDFTQRETSFVGRQRARSRVAAMKRQP